MTYRALARRFYTVLRSHLSPLIPLAIDATIGALSVVMLLVIGAGWGVRYGAIDERERHAESLRHLLPVTEAAMAAHRVELEALKDTVEMLEGVTMEVDHD